MSLTWPDIIQFLHCISRQTLAPVHTDAIRRFAKQPVPWNHVVTLADREGVAGFLFSNLKALNLLEKLPKEASETLQHCYEETQALSQVILEKTERLSVLLGKANMQAMALQGLSVVTTVYGQLGLRRLGDVDVLLQSEHIDDFKAVLSERGYAIQNRAYPDILCKERVCVDVHGHILNLERIGTRRYLFPEDLTAFWERATPFFKSATSETSDFKTSHFKSLGGLLQPDPYDNLVALAAHALKHSYSRLFWLVDIHELLLKCAQQEVGWQNVVDRAAFWRQERIVLYALVLVEKLFGLKVPPWVKAELGIHSFTPWERRLLRLRLKGVSSDMVCNGLWLANIRKTRNKIRFVRETLFPKDDVMQQIFLDDYHRTKIDKFVKRFLQGFQMAARELIRAARISTRSN